MKSGETRHDPRRPAIYEVRIGGHLDLQRADRFDGMDVAWDDDGDTLLTGQVADQAALHGLLRRLRDLGVTLISIHIKEEQMASNVQGGDAVAAVLTRDRKMVLSTLWVFALINYIYADIFTAFFNAPAPGSVTMSGTTLVVLAALMETGIAMVLLSRILTRAWNRWLNVAVGIIQTAFVTWSLFGEPPRPYYLFFVAIEIASTLFITGYAWTWRREQAPKA